MKQYIVDAFAEEIFQGNPAAVLPCKKMPSPELMQKIAIENNYSETAFVVKRSFGNYDLKWFTPGGEIDLCGHATLGTAYVIYHYVDPGINEMHFHTLSGELIVSKSDYGFTMDFPTGESHAAPITPEIRDAVGDIAVEVFAGADTVVIAENEQAVKDFIPNAESILKLDGLGLILTASSNEYDFVSRCFYPKLNVLEDPVTGRAHTFMTPIWHQKLGKEIMRAKQISSRGGILTVQEKDKRILISGSVQLFMEGNIPFDL